MSKKDRSTNLQKESAKQLEAVGEQLRSKWLGHVAREISINVVEMIVLIIAFFAVASIILNVFISDAIKAPISFLDLIVIGYFFLFFLFLLYFFFSGVSHIISSFVSNIIRLLAGPPKAGKTPEKTIEKYFMNLVPTNLNRADWVDAYVCLLDQCKESFGGYDTFITFWKEAKKALSDQITQNFKPHNVGETKWTLDECEVEKGLDGLRNYKVNFKVNVCEWINIGNDSGPYSIDIGAVIVTEWVSFAQVGDRWYVAKTEWEPQLVKLWRRL